MSQSDTQFKYFNKAVQTGVVLFTVYQGMMKSSENIKEGMVKSSENIKEGMVASSDVLGKHFKEGLGAHMAGSGRASNRPGAHGCGFQRPKAVCIAPDHREVLSRCFLQVVRAGCA